MQQSGSVDLDATFFPEEVDCCGMAIDFSCLRAFALQEASGYVGNQQESEHVLEGVRVVLPFPSYLNLDLDTLVDVLGPALVIDAQLKKIAILEFVWPRLIVCWRQANVVEEGSAARLRVPDEEPAPGFNPYLGVRTRDDFALEC